MITYFPGLIMALQIKSGGEKPVLFSLISHLCNIILGDQSCHKESLNLERQRIARPDKNTVEQYRKTYTRPNNKTSSKYSLIPTIPIHVTILDKLGINDAF